MDKITPPTFGEDAFTCPTCNAFSQQWWYTVSGYTQSQGHESFDWLDLARCTRCGEVSVWVNRVLTHPDSAPAPMPNPDLPDEIKSDYMEARSIFTKSARGSAALLRLCIQRLCVHLDQPGENLNTDIGELVKAGLLPRVQQALDAVRVIGNNAVHPGEMDLDDTPEVAQALFGLVNAIAEQLITHPKQVQDLYSKLPPGALDAIGRRDGQS